jgi:autotransporter-associated beta strand protein
VVNVTGGTVTSSVPFTRAGAGSATVNLSGGTLDLGGNAIGDGTNAVTLAATAGTLRNLSQFNGGATLAKTGVGILTLSGTNTYTGQTDIQAGEIRAGAAGGLNAASTFAVGSGTFLSLAGHSATIGGLSGAGTVRNQSATAATLTVGAAGGTFSGVIEDGTGGGALALAKTGSGLLALAGANTYTGGTTVSSGTLSIGAGGATGSIIGDIVNDATVLFDRTSDLTYAGLISGSGGVSKSGTSILVLTGQNSYAGLTTVSGGFLAVGDATALGTTAAGTTVLSGASLVLPGGISVAAEPLSLTGDGAGTSSGALRNEAGTNTWGGPITVTAGATRISSAAGLLRLTGSVTTAGTGNFNLGGTGDVEVTGVVSGPLVLFKSSGGAGTLTLSGANTYDAGPTTVANVFANGVVSVASIGSVGSASSNLGAQTTATAATLGMGSTTTGATLRYTGTGETTDRIVNLRGTTGPVTLDQSGTGLLKFLSNFTATGAGSKTLFLQGSTAGTGEIAGAIVDNGGANLTQLTKSGTGVWTLSGASTYSGGTAINAGRLVAASASALGTGNVTIAAGSILDLDVTPALGSSTVAMSPGGGLVVASGVAVPLAGLSALGGWQIDPSTLGLSTVAKLLSGTVLTGGTTLTGAWTAPASSGLYSDILELSGTGPGNPYVLSMTYDSASASALLESLNIGRRNSGSTSLFAPIGTSFQGVGVPWTSAFTTVGQYGVDTTTQTVWVVADTNSEFVVVPEPATLAFAGVAAATGVALLRRRRAA